MTNRLEFKRDGYNSRRYGKPWGARVTFDDRAKAQYDFIGSYVGDDGGGIVVISCNDGDIVAVGQRDNRGGRTENSWYVVENGEAREVSKEEAYKLFIQRKEAENSQDSEGNDRELPPIDAWTLLEWLRGFGVDGKVDVATLRRLIRQGEFSMHPDDIEKLASEDR